MKQSKIKFKDKFKPIPFKETTQYFCAKIYSDDVDRAHKLILTSMYVPVEYHNIIGHHIGT